jgi:hypothetical protein
MGKQEVATHALMDSCGRCIPGMKGMEFHDQTFGLFQRIPCSRETKVVMRAAVAQNRL